MPACERRYACATTTYRVRLKLGSKFWGPCPPLLCLEAHEIENYAVSEVSSLHCRVWPS